MAIEAMTLDERFERVEFIEFTIDQADVDVTEEQKAVVRSRAAEVQAESTIGLTGDELKTRIGTRWA